MRCFNELQVDGAPYSLIEWAKAHPKEFYCGLIPIYHECERYLRYHATPRKMRKEAGIPAIPWDTSPVAAAILQGGFVWEER